MQNYELIMGQFSKISNQRNFLEKDTDFDWIFYVMQALNKKISKSLFLSPRNSFSWKFLKIGPLIVHSFVKKNPLFTRIPANLSPFHSSWHQSLHIFVFSLAPVRILFSKKVITMTPHNWRVVMGGHSYNFFRKNDSMRS